jgi:NADH-quinone oxidoreductase subunit E
MIDNGRVVSVEDEVGFLGPEGVDGAAALDPAVIELVNELVAVAPAGREGLLAVLLGLQRTFGRVSWRVQELVADRYGMSPVQIAGLVSFFPELSAERRGRLKVEVCVGTDCHLRGADRVIEALSGSAAEAKPVSGEPEVVVEQERCLGLCGLAPVVRVNDRLYAGSETNRIERTMRGWLEPDAAGEDRG